MQDQIRTRPVFNKYGPHSYFLNCYPNFIILHSLFSIQYFENLIANIELRTPNIEIKIAYQFPICSGTIRSRCSSGLCSFQLGSYFTNHDNHNVRERRIRGGCIATRKIALHINQVRKRSSSNENPMVSHQPMQETTQSATDNA